MNILNGINIDFIRGVSNSNHLFLWENSSSYHNICAFISVRSFRAFMYNYNSFIKTINLGGWLHYSWMKNLARQRITLQQNSSFLFYKIIPKVTSSLEIAAGNKTIFCLFQMWMLSQNVCSISPWEEDIVHGFNVIFTECA